MSPENQWQAGAELTSVERRARYDALQCGDSQTGFVHFTLNGEARRVRAGVVQFMKTDSFEDDSPALTTTGFLCYVTSPPPPAAPSAAPSPAPSAAPSAAPSTAPSADERAAPFAPLAAPSATPSFAPAPVATSATSAASSALLTPAAVATASTTSTATGPMTPIPLAAACFMNPSATPTATAAVPIVTPISTFAASSTPLTTVAPTPIAAVPTGLPMAHAIPTAAASFAPPNFAFTFSPPPPPADVPSAEKTTGGKTVSAEEAVHLAAERTAMEYETVIEGMETHHRETTDQLRGELMEAHERANELEDELHWAHEALVESRSEIDTLKAASVNTGNFLTAMNAKSALGCEQRARQSLEMQLREATLRIETLLTERDAERLGSHRHASDLVKTAQIDEGEALRERLTTKASTRKLLAGASAELMTDLTPQRINQLAQHIEAVIFGAGRGHLQRTQLLLAAILDRPVIQRLLGAGAPQSLQAIAVSKEMLETARKTLAQLSSHGKRDEFDRHGRRNDHRGTKSIHARLAFETIVTSMLPEDASERHILRTIEGLLGINHDQITRAVTRKRKAAGNAFVFIEELHNPRKRRKDARDAGRVLCDNWWHANTRFDTCALAPLHQPQPIASHACRL